MAKYDAERIYKAPWWKVGPLRRGRTARAPYVIGWDTEAEQGKPFLFQWSLPGGDRDAVVLQDIAPAKNAGLLAFAYFLYENCQRRDVDYLVFGFNLGYEYTQLFRDMPDRLKNAPEISCEVYLERHRETVKLTGTNDKRYTLTVTLGRSKIRVKVVDAMAYFVMSLDAASKVIDAGAKLAKPKQFAKRYRHTPEFINYAKQDAYLTRLLGEYIINLHERYDVATCMSAPHFASSVFRRHYLQRALPPLSRDVEQVGLDSYHGGKNGYYLSGPKHLRNVWQYDIRSAYPEAMAALPCLECAEWEAVEGYAPGVHALYRLTAIYTGCAYEPAYSNHGPRLAPSSAPVEFATTSYELDEMLACGCLTVLQATRYEMDASGCDCESPALRDYSHEWYAQKAKAPNKAERNTAKLFLNSLYGKFFQKVPRGIVGMYEMLPDDSPPVYIETDPNSDYDYDAGGLYHPPIASLITGYVRAKIHRLEHKYQAIMTSTDGFFSPVAPDPSDLGSELGKLDAQEGELRIWRERLYVFVSTTGERKYALHGFRGKVADLLRLPVAAGIYTYEAIAMISLKMSTRRFRGKSYQPGTFVPFPFVLDLSGPSP